MNFGANARVFFGEFRGEFSENDIDYMGGVNFSTALRMGRLSLPLQGAVSHAKRDNGESINAFSLITSANVGRLALSAQITHEKDSGRPQNDGTEFTIIANRRWRDFRLRGNATFRANGPRQGLDSATVRLEADVAEDGVLQGDFDYNGNSDEFRFTAGYTQRFKEFSLRGDAFITSRGGVGAGIQAAFSLGPDPVSGGVRVTQAKLARHGQAAVTVFRDENGNDRRDEGEQVLENILVEAGLRSTDAITGANGTAIVDELRPFEPVLVGIDESSLEDPFLAPSAKGIVVTPRPGVAAQIELAVSPTGEVEGSLLSVTGTEQSGVRLQLVDERGAVAAEVISEFDGFFLFQRVPYGQYRLRISDDAAQALDVKPGLSLKDGRTVFIINRDEDIIRFGTVKLAPTKATDPPRDRPEGPLIAAASSE